MKRYNLFEGQLDDKLEETTWTFWLSTFTPRNLCTGVLARVSKDA